MDHVSVGEGECRRLWSILRFKFSRNPVDSDWFDTETWRDEGRWCLAGSGMSVSCKLWDEKGGFKRFENGVKNCALLSDGCGNRCVDDICSVNKYISDGFGLLWQYLCLSVLRKKARSAASISLRDITKRPLLLCQYLCPCWQHGQEGPPWVTEASTGDGALRGSRRALLRRVPESPSAGEAEEGDEPLAKPPCRAYSSVWGSAGVFFLFPT